MKAHLMYRDRDFDPEQKPPPNEKALIQDLELDTLFSAMAGGDEFLSQVAKQAVLSGLRDDRETILYRQDVLKDCLRNFSVVKEIYDLAVEAIESKKRQWFGIFSHYPSSILSGAVELLKLFMATLKKLKLIADEHSDKFQSEGFAQFFALIKAELADEYFATVQEHLKELKLRAGVLVSADLGEGNQGENYVLRGPFKKRSWIERIFDPGPPGYTFRIAERDEAGARSLSELQDRGLNLVANALAQSSDHILSFFVMLRMELAFYVGCVNLRGQLSRNVEDLSFPVPAALGARTHTFVGLRDVCLALSIHQKVAGNTLNADRTSLVVITGANQGGKSTFLRSIGLAQLMMQCGMFVAAESFSADIRRSLFTHYKREEDATMESGKLDEELSRMSEIVDALTPNSMLLLNESFAATNEREGSEIARQIVRALLEAGVKVFFVTHLYEFAHGFCEDKTVNAVFLRAERKSDGRRTFKLTPGHPLQTSFGVDLYDEIFDDVAERAGKE